MTNNTIPDNEKKKKLETPEASPRKRKKYPIINSVLLVEDSKLIRVMLKHQLSDLGLKVYEAENGREGLKQLGSIGADNIVLVLLDSTMPIMSGVEFLEEAKKIYEELMPPVVVCTTDANEKTIKSFAGLGVDGYIIKPFTTQTFIDKVGKIINFSDTDINSANN